MLRTALSLVALVAMQPVRAQVALPDADGAAKLLTFTGQISVVRSGYAWALNTGSTVKPQEVIVTGPDGWGVFQVADGSKFEVFPNSRVVFRANRGDWKDLLEVFLGKVRVQIEHFGGLPNNNKVHTPSAVISVRGTIFVVEVEDQSDTTLVEDEEGVVEVRHLLRPGPVRVLNPGDYVRVFKNEPIGKALFDKGGLLQRAVRAASDAFYQVAINARNSAGVARGGTGGSTGGPADGNNGKGSNTPPPAPPPPPPPPAPPQ
ncbi:MAG TPA: FecR family protein [Bryobacteraceae bacterium]|nr:FecR family protein [Bryobacteraceae bacterium]